MSNEQLLTMIFGAVLAFMQAAVLYQNKRRDERQDRMESAMMEMVKDIAAMKGTLLAFDMEEISRMRHRVTNVETEVARQGEEIRGIRNTCAYIHRETFPQQQHG